MGMLRVKVSGRETLKWAGGENEVANLEAAFCQIAATRQGAPVSIAAAAVDDFVRNGLAKDNARAVYGMAVVYFLLQQDTGTPSRPGRIRDYVAVWDFEFDLYRRDDGGIRIQISGTSGSWS